MREGTHARTNEKIRLTSHSTTMHFVIEFPGDGVVPRQGLRPIPQLLMATTSKQSTQNGLAHWQVVQDLVLVEENSDRHRVQHNGLQRAHHLNQED